MHDPRMSMTHAPFPALAVCLLLLGGCASAPPPSITEVEPIPEAQTIRPGDAVRLMVWREEDLSGTFLVDQDGRVVLPRVGRVDVTAETEASLEDRLLAELGRELRNASIDVTVLRRIQILGAVERPGLYSLDHTMTVRDALAQAGGVSPEGKRDRLHMVRDGQRYMVPMEEELPVGEVPLRSGDALVVPKRMWLLRNPGTVVTGITSLLGVAVAIISVRASSDSNN